ncbi:MAG TPA: hypothetical protein VHI98_19070 [Vicinamibacterales bacterium]|nr:hypothetical protein [Vicinamibacterales bacterium]HEX2460813.1 hypothetical protein [Vicinamibacterales bacterium]
MDSDSSINLILVGSQTFWISRVGTVGTKIVTRRKWRLGLGAFGLVIYVALLAYNLQNWENVSKGSTLSLRAAPFIAGAYGLLSARLNLQTTYQRVTLGRLPNAFEGFRIVQLSDLHISAFMTADQIRRFAAIANDLKPDLVAVTGDFLTWDESAQRTVVEALSGLKAPFGVFGSSPTRCERELPFQIRMRPPASRLRRFEIADARFPP